MKPYVFDKTLNKILQEAYEKFKDVATPDQIREVFLLFWDDAAMYMEKDELPSIYGLLYFGMFKPQIHRVVNKINRLKDAATNVVIPSIQEGSQILASKYEETLARLLKEKQIKKINNKRKWKQKVAVN